MRAGSASFSSFVGLLSAVLLVGAWGCVAIQPAWAGIQVYSGSLASCAATDPSGATADLVATGAVEEATVRPDSSAVRVRLDRVYKGESGETVEILTSSGSRSGNSVDATFAEGERYLLYLQREGDVWTTNICLGTQQVGATLAPELAAALGEGVAPEGLATIPETGGPDVPPLVALVGLAVSGAGAMLWRWARQAKARA